MRLYLREVLQDDSGRLEWNLDVFLGVSDPLEDLLDVAGEHVKFVAVSDGRLEQDTHGVGQSLYLVSIYQRRCARHRRLNLPILLSPRAGNL